MDIVFLKPLAFLLLLLPLITLISKNKVTQKEVIYFPNMKLLKQTFAPKRQFSLKTKAILNFFALYLVWALLTISMADPNITERNNKINTIGYDIMLLLDISGSMEALDFSTEDELITRLDITKKVVKKFIKKRNGDRIGIIVFGQFAYLESPLTIDNITLLNILDNTEIGMAGQATAIGDAITMAVNKLHKKEKNSRAIILLTDGENTSGKIMPVTSAKLAKKYQIPIYTIGIGKNGEAPFINKYGQLEYAFVTLDIVTLKEIAKITGGKYFNAQNEKRFNEIYNEINKLTATTVKNQTTIKYIPIFHYFVIAAILIFILIIASSLKLFPSLRHVDKD